MPSHAKSISVNDTSFSPAVSDCFCPLREPGPHIPDSVEICPISLFELFFDEKVVDRIIESTLAYADHKKDYMPNSYFKFLMMPFSKLELFSYIGSLLL